MKARVVIFVCVLALPLAALGFSLFSEGLRSGAPIETADLVAASASLPGFLAGSAAPDSWLGLSLQINGGLTAWNAAAGVLALLFVIFLRRL